MMISWAVYHCLRWWGDIAIYFIRRYFFVWQEVLQQAVYITLALGRTWSQQPIKIITQKNVTLMQNYSSEYSCKQLFTHVHELIFFCLWYNSVQWNIVRMCMMGVRINFVKFEKPQCSKPQKTLSDWFHNMKFPSLSVGSSDTIQAHDCQSFWWMQGVRNSS